MDTTTTIKKAPIRKYWEKLVRDNGLTPASDSYDDLRQCVMDAGFKVWPGGRPKGVKNTENALYGKVEKDVPFNNEQAHSIVLGLEIGDSVQLRKKYSRDVYRAVMRPVFVFRKNNGVAPKDFRLKIAQCPKDARYTRIWRVA